MAVGEARVCHQCFEDDFLKREIRRKGSRDECNYCGKTLVTLSLDSIADLFESAIETHYEKTPSGPSEMEQAMLNAGVMDFWYPDGQPVVDVIQEIGDTSAEIAGDIQSRACSGSSYLTLQNGVSTLYVLSFRNRGCKAYGCER